MPAQETTLPSLACQRGSKTARQSLRICRTRLGSVAHCSEPMPLGESFECSPVKHRQAFDTIILPTAGRLSTRFRLREIPLSGCLPLNRTRRPLLRCRNPRPLSHPTGLGLHPEDGHDSSLRVGSRWAASASRCRARSILVSFVRASCTACVLPESSSARTAIE